MAQTLREMMEAANAAAPRITPQEGQALIQQGDVVIVDVRDAAELAQTGKIAGAIHIPRALLEFRADPSLPSHDPRLRSEATVLVYCASGGRSALGGKTLKDMGYDRVFNLGGFQEWAMAGGAVERA